MATLCQQQDGGSMLLCKRYVNNMMAAMRYYGEVILHLQQYSRRLNLLFFLLALQPPLGVVFYSPLTGFSLLAYEVS